MSEFRKIPADLITAHKPDEVKDRMPLGKELLGRSYFEKLRQSLNEKYRLVLDKFLEEKNSLRRLKILKRLGRGLPEKDLVTLASQYLDTPKKGLRRNIRNFLTSESPHINHHSLYVDAPRSLAKSPDEKGRLPVHQFAKNGPQSELVLIGSEYIGKQIARVLPREKFKLWVKAFTRAGVWQEAGFDYVPVEPILANPNGKYRVGKAGEPGFVTVFTKVLGKNMNDFLAKKPNSKFAAHLEEMKEKIGEVLEHKLKINHGHLHEGNFCVEMHEGQPRLYVIDFDLAEPVKTESKT